MSESLRIDRAFGEIVATKPRRKVMNLSSFEITTDSVVAKATITTSTRPRRIFIDWGDGKSDTIRTLPGAIVPVGLGQPDPLPEGTYEIHHTYDEPEIRRAFEHTVLLQVSNAEGLDDLRLRTITLTPRYKVVHYQTYVRLLGSCDGPGSSSSNFDIDQYIGENHTGHWDWFPSNSFFSDGQFYALPGSQFVREFSTDDQSQTVILKFREHDFFEDDTGQYRAFINAQSETTRVELDQGVGGSFGGCKVRLFYDREVTIVANNPANTSGSIAAFSVA